MAVVKIKEYQKILYEYATMVEMTNHISIMGGLGWNVINVNETIRRAEFRKDL